MCMYKKQKLKLKTQIKSYGIIVHHIVSSPQANLLQGKVKQINDLQYTPSPLISMRIHKLTYCSLEIISNGLEIHGYRMLNSDDDSLVSMTWICYEMNADRNPHDQTKLLIFSRNAAQKYISIPSAAKQ